MLFKRIIAGAILFPLCVGIMWFGGWLLTATLLLIYTIINYEFFGFAANLGPRRRQQLTVVSLLLPTGFLVFGFEGLFGGLVLAVMVSFLLFLIVIETERHQPEFSNFVPGVALGFCYTGLFGSLMVACASAKGGNLLMLWLLSIVVASDTFAFFGGRAFGKDPLSPRISPNKTLWGGFCGLLAAFVVGILLGYYMEFNASIPLIALYSLLAGLLAQVGDLVESLVKRVYEVKDAGSLIPGHGGILDRVDSFLFSCPLLYFMNVFA